MNTITYDNSDTYRYWLGVALLPFSLLIALVWGLYTTPLPWQFSLSWVPSLDIALAFRIDALSAQMLVLITGIGTAVFVYAVGYLDKEQYRWRIFTVLPLFMFAMIGAVSADDVIVLFLFWELTSLTSFLLVGFKHTQAEAREAAKQALLITMGGGLALLGGFILLSQITETRLLSVMLADPDSWINDPRLPYAIGLILLGAFTKSAQFPFHFWLPNAMSAPTPVSAYLHSATMVKLGIYLMARLDSAFNDLLLWEITLITIGTLTALWAAILALRERDLKRILARSTVSALGTLTLLIGLPSPNAGLAVVTFLFAHAVYKAPLFMVAGNIDHATGTRVIDNLMGLRHVMPGSALVSILAGLSMAGLPLAVGFAAKDAISLAKAQADLLTFISYSLILVNAIAVAVAGVAAIRVFWGSLDCRCDRVHDVPWLMLLPPLSIALFGLEFLFLPYITPLLLSAAQVISPALVNAEVMSYDNMKLFITTTITVSIGVILFLFWDWLHKIFSRVEWVDRYGAEASYNALMRALPRVAARHTRLIQSGYLDIYLQFTLFALLVMGMFAAWHTGLRLEWAWQWQLQGWFWIIASGLMIAGAWAAVRLQNRLAVLMASGLVGYASALLFLFSAAPDLAFTQFSVETILVVIAAAILPRFTAMPSISVGRITILTKLLLAILAGVGTFILLLHLQALPEQRQLAEWFAAHSLADAYGRNVVNVIIVDFRALDTLGEIAVVAFTLLAALPLLKQLKNNTIANQPVSPMLTISALPLYGLMLGVALWILLRGHNAPGGGFIGGLIAVAASSLLATVHKPATALRWQPLPPLALAITGLSFALLAGIIGKFFGPEFLHHLWYGKQLSTAMLFDLGVFCVVWGVLTGIIYGLLERPK